MTPKTREELVILIDGYVEGVDGADVLSDLESHGLRIVPVEPTQAMEDAHFDAHAEAEAVFADVPDIWSAMLAASPFAKEG